MSVDARMLWRTLSQGAEYLGLTVSACFTRTSDEERGTAETGCVGP